MTVRPEKGKVMEPTGTTGTITVLHTKNHSRFVHAGNLGLHLLKKNLPSCVKDELEGLECAVYKNVQYTDIQIHRDKYISEIKPSGKSVICGRTWQPHDFGTMA